MKFTKLILCDTLTGINTEIDTSNSDQTFSGASFEWWATGNGSCDCNRASCFGDDVEDELEAEYGEGGCFGSNRFLITDIIFDDVSELDADRKSELLFELNSDYPQELLNVFILGNQV